MGQIETFLIHIGRGLCYNNETKAPAFDVELDRGWETIMRDARYIDIPGSGTHELPPLLIHSATEHAPAENLESRPG